MFSSNEVLELIDCVIEKHWTGRLRPYSSGGEHWTAIDTFDSNGVFVDSIYPMYLSWHLDESHRNEQAQTEFEEHVTHCLQCYKCHREGDPWARYV